MRVARPTLIDFAALADGVIRNNMGVGGFRLQGELSVQDGAVLLHPDRQRWPLQGPAPADASAPRWREAVVVLDEDAEHVLGLQLR